MESAYTLANRELEAIKNTNRELQSLRKSEVLLKAPRLGEIEAELMKCGTRLLECVLKKNCDFNEVKSCIRRLQAEKLALLESNGFPENYLDEIYSCISCRDTGFVEGKRCDCLKALISKHVSANSNLTEHMKKQTFENFDFSLFANQKDDSARVLRVANVICDKASTFADSFDETHENLLLIGNAGTGKTYVSSCIANRALEVIDALVAGGIDPDEYTGFAFGLGLTRLAMMKYGVKDIRDFNSGNQFFQTQCNGCFCVLGEQFCNTIHFVFNHFLCFVPYIDVLTNNVVTHKNNSLRDPLIALRRIGKYIKPTMSVRF